MRPENFTKDPVSYDVKRHGVGARVVELRTGRRGRVRELRVDESGNRDVLVEWDGSNEVSRPSFDLIMECEL